MRSKDVCSLKHLLTKLLRNLPQLNKSHISFSLILNIRMSSEVCQLCLEALTPLAEQCAKAQETDSSLFLATRHFLKVRYLIMSHCYCA